MPNSTRALTCTPCEASTSASCSSTSRCGEAASTSWRASMSSCSSWTATSSRRRWAASMRPTSVEDVTWRPPAATMCPARRRRTWSSTALPWMRRSRCCAPTRFASSPSASSRRVLMCSSDRLGRDEKCPPSSIVPFSQFCKQKWEKEYIKWLDCFTLELTYFKIEFSTFSGRPFPSFNVRRFLS